MAIVGGGGMFVARKLVVEYLAVARGGDGGPVTPASGGLGGGGGAGELIAGSGLIMRPGDTIGIDFDPPSFSGSIDLTGAISGRLLRGGNGAGPPGHGAAGGSGGGASNGIVGTGGASSKTIGLGNAGGPGTATGSPGTLGNAGSGGDPAGPGTLGGLMGPGYTSSISGTSVIYARGGECGSGGNTSSTPGSGGCGGDGLNSIVASEGIAGVVIIRYQGPQRATGGSISSAGGYTIHTFTTDGTFTVS